MTLEMHPSRDRPAVPCHLMVAFAILLAPCCKRDESFDAGERNPREIGRSMAPGGSSSLATGDDRERAIWDGLRSGKDLPDVIKALDQRWSGLDESTRDTAGKMAASNLENQINDANYGFVRELETEELSIQLSTTAANAMLDSHPHQAVEFMLGIHNGYVREQVAGQVATHWAESLASAADRTPIRAAIEWFRREPAPGVKGKIWTSLNTASLSWDYGSQLEWDELSKKYGFRK